MIKVLLFVLMIIMVSGCMEEVSSSDVAEEIRPLLDSNEQPIKEDVIVQMIPHNDGDYECIVSHFNDLEITVIPKGQNFVIILKNIGDSTVFIEKVKAQIDQKREKTEREVNRNVSLGEELIVTFKDRGQGQVLPKIYLVEVIRGDSQ